MNRLLTLVLILLICANGYYAWYQVTHAHPTQAELDGDLQVLDGEIAEAKTAAAKYDKGLLVAVILARLEILETTRAMLQQKRSSILRGINLAYTVDGQGWKPASEADLKAVGAELGKQQARTQIADIKAAGAGGLLGIMAKVEAQAEHLTETMLLQRALAAKYGLPYAKVVADTAEQQKEALGKIVKDQDGL